MARGDVLGPLRGSHTKGEVVRIVRSRSEASINKHAQGTEVVHVSPSIRKRPNRLASSWLGTFWRSKPKPKSATDNAAQQPNEQNAAELSDAPSYQEPSTKPSPQQKPKSQTKSSEKQLKAPESDSEPEEDQDAQIAAILSGKIDNDTSHDSDSSAEYWRTIDSPYHLSKQTIYDGQIFYER
ncbi:hypothetical protein LTS08_004946 [Lithohypha guttulata]|uniref:Uncharacterized protein n=1 Tax=Lithohypha guttulata TaxID=1690604 RepID=A0AAN7T3D2_9EURO|nr:hypothetical protein LTR05_002208 [Lithohypha guttulata]KAK5101339.1 hypothetical protein LTS08_004946 [Lithohypha guttulata]